MTQKRTIEARFPCPVCLGVTLQKVRLAGSNRELVLDACARCGGIWFELGEVQQLRAHPPKALWTLMTQRAEAHRGSCHHCHSIIDRNAATCDVCNTANRIDCPSCQRQLDVQTHEGLRLDVCRRCKGVWFDHVELEAVWRLSVKATGVSRRSGGDVDGADTAAFVLLDTLTYSPGLVLYGAQAAGMAVQSGAQLLANAPEASGALFDGAGDAAAGVFEAVLEIIGGIFN